MKVLVTPNKSSSQLNQSGIFNRFVMIKVEVSSFLFHAFKLMIQSLVTLSKLKAATMVQRLLHQVVNSQLNLTKEIRRCTLRLQRESKT